MLAIEATWDNIRKIEKIALKYNLDLDPAIYELWDNYPTVPQEISGFNFTLSKDQADGVRWLEMKDGRGLISDEIDTGMLIQSLAYAHRNSKFPMLIVTSKDNLCDRVNQITHAVGSTYKINILSPYPIYGIDGSSIIISKAKCKSADVYVVAYSVLSKYIDQLENLNLKLLIVDDAYYALKTHKTLISKSIKRLAVGYTVSRNIHDTAWVRTEYSSGIPHLIFCSTKTFLERPSEIFNIVNILADYVPEFKYYYKFTNEFCSVHWQNGYSQVIGANNNIARLQELLDRHVMLRRTKTI